MGVSFVITTIVVPEQIHDSHVFRTIPPGYVIGALVSPHKVLDCTVCMDNMASKHSFFLLQFIICGILYIITEHNPTKRTVSIICNISKMHFKVVEYFFFSMFFHI